MCCQATLVRHLLEDFVQPHALHLSKLTGRMGASTLTLLQLGNVGPVTLRVVNIVDSVLPYCASMSIMVFSTKISSFAFF